MTTVRRTIRSSPYRSANATWNVITDLLAVSDESARHELDEVAGIASSIIVDRACIESPIIVSCNGPQTRIYCLFDDESMDESDANEDVLNYNPLAGDWSISLPCQEEDLEWIEAALKKKSERITARNASESTVKSSGAKEETSEMELNIERFMES